MLSCILPLIRIKIHTFKVSVICFKLELGGELLRRLSTMSDDIGTYSLKSNDIFIYNTDRFKGVTVNSEDQYCEEEDFCCKLQTSLQKWKADQIRAVWFRVALRHTTWIPILSQHEFVFHRVETNGQSVVMCKWLPKDLPNHIPPYSHTMIGVGGIVLNKQNEILVVQERYGSKSLLKLPGGYVEPDEDISSAAIREVEEETGIRTIFKYCVMFRHTHGANFDCSDIYFIVSLRPINEDHCEKSEEVVKVQWMRMDEFLNHPEVHELNRRFLQTYLHYKEENIAIVKEEGLHPVTKKRFSMFFATRSSEA